MISLAPNQKIKDTDLQVSRFSRADRYWKARGFEELFRKLRTPQMRIPAEDPYTVMSRRYKTRALEFGNWVSIEMRYNYLIGSIVAAEDIQQITGLKNFGYGILALSFGARGGGRALAHFEPREKVINLTRFPRGMSFTSGGGLGALAHEYGHFLDYHFGVRTTNASGSQALSGGRSTTTTFNEKELSDPGAWGAMSRFLQAVIYAKDDLTTYYRRVREKAGENVYWYRRNELFARAFEQYIQYKLEKKGITNTMLTQRKYESAMYWRPEEFAPLVPLLDQVLKKMRAIKKK